MVERFEKIAEDAADYLKQVDKEILVISHYDCDGISSGIIARMLLEKLDKQFVNVFLDEITEEKLEKVLEKNNQEVVFFTDIGSGQKDVISDLTDDRTVVVADHHEVVEEGEVDYHVNPMLIENGEVIDGGKEISGAGVTYYLAEKALGNADDLLPYALIGATGDIQKKEKEFTGMNKKFLEEADEKDLIDVKEGLDLYGRSSKSLVKALKYTTDPHLEGISNDESGTVQFLRSLDIDLRDENGWISLSDLTDEEEREIIHGLIKRGYDGVEELFGTVYVLDNGWEIQEFSSLLNACGKLEKPEKAFDICLENDFETAMKVKTQYGRKIGRYLSIIEDKKGDSSFIQETEFGTIIDAGTKIHPNIIGTVTTIAIKSDILQGPVVMGMAVKEKDFLKVSVRVVDEYEDEVELNTLMEEVCEKVDGKGGGHKMAAGGKIPRDRKDEFIQIIKDFLKQLKD